METPVYSGTLGFLQPSGRTLIEIQSDHHGISAVELERVLANWHSDPATSSLKFPKVVYSIVTQAIAGKLLSHWGFDRFEAHCDQVSKFYSDKLEVVDAAAQKHLAGLAEWNKPVAGMFLWLKLNIAIPGKEEEADSSALISTRAVQKGVLAVPGCAFLPNAGKSAYVRTSFSLIDADSADEGFARLASVIREARVEAGLE
ncbi:hypothetical protein PGTUg99_036721 [Puccinia graminis f. sp. tritici]|uniref:Aminotransferase class I/classII domain-containing protein n=1 Tax=Puccinia graminis f. sp. tritici TaxID=56615 RepID=A0A5B0PNS7_PUCGR|nr:hypothetical protein PGTUg99_036721 [Puccinia graminis f. sp. tritici]